MTAPLLSRKSLSAAAFAALFLTTGCAIGNSGKLVLARHISIGQELMDLHEAQKTGAITDEEFEMMKAKLMEAIESIEIVTAVNDATPDQMTSEPEAD